MIILTLPAGFACTLFSRNKVKGKMIKKKQNKYKRQVQKDQQTIKSFDKLYRKSSQDHVYDKDENQSLCNIFLNIWMKQETNLFYK